MTVPTHPWAQPATTHVNNTRSCKCSLDAPDDKRKYCSKHVEQSRNNKLHLVCYLCKLFFKLVCPLHIHMNILASFLTKGWRIKAICISVHLSLQIKNNLSNFCSSPLQNVICFCTVPKKSFVQKNKIKVYDVTVRLSARPSGLSTYFSSERLNTVLVN
jgi:hypothetical protein